MLSKKVKKNKNNNKDISNVIIKEVNNSKKNQKEIIPTKIIYESSEDEEEIQENLSESDDNKKNKIKSDSESDESINNDADSIQFINSENSEINLLNKKKKKIEENFSDSSDDELSYHKKNKKQKTKEPALNQNFTVSIVIPSSVVDNAQSKELRSYLVGQIARTAGIFKIDEIIIFHDKNKSTQDRDYINFFVTNLQYLETPQYLRKTLFPRCDDLSNSGLINPLDSSHHLRIDEWCQYREGVILNRPVKENNGSWCNIGLYKECKINQQLQEKTRVTVKLNEKSFDKNIKFYTGDAVSVTEPREKLNLYWGYLVRLAKNFEEIFENSSYEKKYDLIIGTSDKGKKYDEVDYKAHRDFKHCLIVFGGLQGIEGMIEFDEKSKLKDKDLESMFDLYLNTCPDQGCRTIRSEEAIMISLSVLKPILNNLKN